MAAQRSGTRADRATRANVAQDERERAPAAEQAGIGWGWPFLATIGLGGFALITWAVASKIVLPFDQPLLDAAAGLGQYMPAWRGLSDSANLPLIAVGVAIVAFLLFTQAAGRGRARLRRPRRRHRRQRGRQAARRSTATAGLRRTTRAGVVYSYPVRARPRGRRPSTGSSPSSLWRSSLPTIVRVAVPILF